MEDMLAGNLEGIMIFLIIISLITLSNLIYLRPLLPVSIGNLPYFNSRNFSSNIQALPRVSILIPARNEEKNIGCCLDSILFQDYPSLEIIVLDDNSTDSTGAILQKYMNTPQKDNKNFHSITLLQGQKLPCAWTGKNWACHQLALEATGELILFVDADTTLNTQAVSTAVGKISENNLDLVSFIPKQKMVSWAEKFVVPLIFWSVMFFMPLVLAYRLKISKLAMGVGQFIMFNHKTYKKLGGHEAIKEKIVDDIAMVRHFKQHRARWAIFNGVKLVSCRMYSNFKQTWEGFTKNLFGFFDYFLLPYLFIWGWLLFTFLFPLIILFIALGNSIIPVLSGSISDFTIASISSITGEVQIRAVMAVFLSLIIWATVNITFHIPFRMTFIYPVSIFLTSLIAFNSALQYFRGGITWKGRNLLRKVS